MGKRFYLSLAQISIVCILLEVILFSGCSAPQSPQTLHECPCSYVKQECILNPQNFNQECKATRTCDFTGDACEQGYQRSTIPGVAFHITDNNSIFFHYDTKGDEKMLRIIGTDRATGKQFIFKQWSDNRNSMTGQMSDDFHDLRYQPVDISFEFPVPEHFDLELTLSKESQLPVIETLHLNREEL